MDLELKNIGVIKNSTVKFEGLTVITGKNSTGKTTIGKTMFSLISSVENIFDSAIIDKTNYSFSTIRSTLEEFQFFWLLRLERDSNFIDFFPNIFQFLTFKGKRFHYIIELVEFIEKLKKEFENLDFHNFTNFANYSLLNKKFNSSTSKLSIENQFLKAKSEIIKSLIELINDLQTDQELIKYSNAKLMKTLNLEFNNQLTSLNCPKNENSVIKLFENGETYFDLNISNNKLINEDSRCFYSSPFKNTIFVDDVYSLDLMMSNSSRSQNNFFDNEESFYINRTMHYSLPNKIVDIVQPKNHNKLLVDYLISETNNIFEGLIGQEKTKKIFELIKQILPESIKLIDGKFVCSETKLDIRNLATGSKMFAIIKLLLEKGLINSKTLLILDEPESHLHPEWQNAFAEIIVLLVKELGVNILLTTHSSNFLLALDTFSLVHGIKTKSHFYRASPANNISGCSNLINIDRNIKQAYAEMSKPFLEMDAKRIDYLQKSNK